MKKISIVILSLLFALALTVSPALAYGQDGPDHHGDEAGNNDVITNENSACVENDVVAVADTGDNYAGGSYAGDGGEGGSIKLYGQANLNMADTGAGGTGGNAGPGGYILTGEAIALAEVKNLVNTNNTEVDRCACQQPETAPLQVIEGPCCDEEEGNNVVVSNENRVRLENDVKAIAKTGDNRAKGSYAGDGEEGGDIKVYQGGAANLNDVSTGAGGNGGTSLDGGWVETGPSSAVSSVMNILNRNVTRIMR